MAYRCNPSACADASELLFHIFSALAQFERRLIQERTRAGIAAARDRGRKGGRPRLKISDPKLVLAKELHGDMSLTIDQVCGILSISRSTYYRYARTYRGRHVEIRRSPAVARAEASEESDEPALGLLPSGASGKGIGSVGAESG